MRNNTDIYFNTDVYRNRNIQIKLSEDKGEKRNFCSNNILHSYYNMKNF